MKTPSKNTILAALLTYLHRMFAICWATRNDENPILMPKAWAEDPNNIGLRDLASLIGPVWAYNYRQTWKTGELRANNLIKKNPLHIKRLVPANGFHPSNLMTTTPSSNLIVEEDKAYTEAYEGKKNKKLKKTDKLPDFLYEEDENGKKKLMWDLKRKEFTKARRSSFTFPLRVPSDFDGEKYEMVSPTWEQLPDEVKGNTNKITYSSEAIPGFTKEFDLRKYCEVMGYPYYFILNISILSENFTREDVDAAADLVFTLAIEGWMKEHKIKKTKKSVEHYLQRFKNLVDSLANLYPKLTRSFIVKELIKTDDYENGTPDGLNLTKEFDVIGDTIGSIAKTSGYKSPCWLWKPNSGFSLKFQSIEELAAELGLSTTYLKTLIREGKKTKEGYYITRTPDAPSAMENVIQMRKIKERALNLDGPFMKAVLSPLQRDLLSFAIIDGQNLETISLILNLNLKVIHKLIDEAFNLRDEIEQIAAEGVGLNDEEFESRPAYQGSYDQRRAKRDRERRDDRRAKAKGAKWDSKFSKQE